MRIEGSNAWSGIEGLNSSQKERSRAESPSTAISSTADDAQLSPAATLASSLLQRLGDVPEIRQDKVDQLRNSISAGTYKVSSDQIAGAMLNDLRP
jgi:negative regulator of flagellin synthesis FlgM